MQSITLIIFLIMYLFVYKSVSSQFSIFLLEWMCNECRLKTKEGEMFEVGQTEKANKNHTAKQIHEEIMNWGREDKKVAFEQTS